MLPIDIKRRDFLLGTGYGIFTFPSDAASAGSMDLCGPVTVDSVDRRFTLAGLGWVDGAAPDIGPKVAGARLRWLFPSSEVVAGSARGIPKRVRVQRAEFDPKSARRPKPTVGSIPTMGAPENVWSVVAPQKVSDSPYVLGLDRAQAIHFGYSGPACTISIEDASGALRSSFAIKNGDIFYLERAAIDRIAFSLPQSAGISLTDLRSLDLFRTNIDLNFKDIAEIAVGVALDQRPAFAELAKRLGSAPTPGVDMAWKLFADAVARLPTLPAGEYAAMLSQIDSILGLSWQLSVIAGFGFVDGPAPSGMALDKRLGPVLPSPSKMSLAYRVVDEASSLKSNVTFVDGGVALPLDPPQGFALSKETYVRPITVNENPPQKPTDPKGSTKSSFVTEGKISWAQKHQWAIGLEIEESVSKSDWLGTATDTGDIFILRPSTTEGLNYRGQSTHAREVSFVDVGLSYRARCFDGFDRTSAFAQKVRTDLTLDYVPPAPTLSSCSFAPPEGSGSGRSTLKRVVDSQALKELVRFTDARLFAYRRASEPSSLAVNVMAVGPLHDGLITVTLNRRIDSARFQGGRLLLEQDSFDIAAIKGQDLEVKAIRSSATASACGNSWIVPHSGAASVLDAFSAKHLWTQRTLWSDTDEPASDVTFDESLPVPEGKADSVVYAARFEYRRAVRATRSVGDFSNTVFALRMPREPKLPPPFSVALLGRDFYGRMLVEITLSAPAPKQQFSVGWRQGRELDAGAAKAPLLDGQIGPQAPYQETVLYEALPYADPEREDVYYTIGVKGSDEAGQESQWRLMEVLVEAA